MPRCHTRAQQDAEREAFYRRQARYAEWPCRDGWVIHGAPSWWYQPEVGSGHITRRQQGLFVSVYADGLTVESPGWEHSPEGFLAAQEWAEAAIPALVAMAPKNNPRNSAAKEEPASPP